MSLSTCGPLVSCIIIFLNAEKFIQAAVDSVRLQSYTNWELLLVDDGSDDRSTWIARRFAEQHPDRVRYLEHNEHQNRGMSASRNLAIRNARGRYLAFLDADDVWLPQKLEQQVAILESHPEADMVFGPSQFWFSWSNAGQPDFVAALPVSPNTLVKPPTLLTASLGAAHPATIGSLLVRRDRTLDVGGFEESFRAMYEDQVFLAKIYVSGSVYVSGECSFKYRMRPDSSTFAAARAGKERSARVVFLKWLDAYLTRQGVRDPDLWRAVREAQWPYRHPAANWLSKNGRRLLERLRALSEPAWMGARKLRRRLTGQSSGCILAHPNPIQVPGSQGDRFAPVGATTLTWESRKTTAVEVHVGAPDGPLLSQTKPTGRTTTGQWVHDGMLFYLQDATAGKPLTAANTLDRIRIAVNPVERRRREPVGGVRFGSFRRLTPISCEWGMDRGRPIDRVYIEEFLTKHASDIRGRVLEIGDAAYTRKFGQERVSRIDVLNPLAGDPETTIVGDLASAPQIPSNAFDCVILTQTLQYIYDLKAAAHTLHRILKPGGVLLATVPGTTQTYDARWGRQWYWSLTSLSSRRLFEEAFVPRDVTIEAFGNVLTAISFLHGLAAAEVSREEMEYRDPGYEVTITIRAVKALTDDRRA